MDLNVVPLFSSPLVVKKLDNPLSIGKDLENHSDLRADRSASRCLDKYPEDKKTILNVFHEFSKKSLGLENQKFKISTSWVTKTTRNNSPGGFHSHKNSYYSGIFYFSEGEGFAPLLLDNLQNDRHFFFIPKHSIENGDPVIANTFHAVPPQKNLLLFFPSYLSHAIGKHDSSEIRYSLAFNIVPDGEIGFNDSTVSIN